MDSVHVMPKLNLFICKHVLAPWETVPRLRIYPPALWNYGHYGYR